MKKIRQFRVYFEQVNQSFETVRVVDRGDERKTQSKAIRKARRTWRSQNATPHCIGVEEDRLK